jgi:hypothetical protein
MQQQGQEPKLDHRYAYDVKQADNGKRYAINLQPQQDQGDLKADQARAQRG